VNEFLNNLKTIWAGWGRERRPLIIVLALGVVVLAVALGFWVFHTNYQVLFSDLDARDAAAIVEELKRIKVPYQVADGGSKVLVEERTVHETRLRLMGKGVPLSGGVGFEIFDNKDVGMTEYTQKINYQRALQGELARTIMSINQVKQARVHLVIAETALFKRQKAKPKASVSLVMKPGSALAGEQIAGIQRLIAAAVPGLEPGAVTVLDQAGVALSAMMEEDEDFLAASGKLRLKKNAEDYFIRKITSVLDRTFGPGQAIVSVDVTLNLDEVKRTQQTVVPLRAGGGEDAGAVVRKRQSVYRNSKAPITKVVDGETYPTGASPDLTSTTDVEYELGKTVEQVVSAPGGIRRISVGIVVPKMNADQMQRVADVVSMIVGYSSARGDAISVQPIDQMLAPVDLAVGPSAGDTSATTAPSDRPSGGVSQLWSNPTAVWATAVLVALVMLVALSAMAWRTRRDHRLLLAAGMNLSDEQRRERLSEIKAWLAAERSRGSA
jgi:flagellar M-ring protein FliF